jgi:hypothetical protein
MLAFCRVLPPVRLATRRGLGPRYGVYLRILVESDSNSDFTLLHSRDGCQHKKKKEAAKGREVLGCLSLNWREHGGDVFLLRFIDSVMIVMGFGSVWLIYPFADDDKAFGWRLWDFLGDGKLTPRFFSCYASFRDMVYKTMLYARSLARKK